MTINAPPLDGPLTPEQQAENDRIHRFAAAASADLLELLQRRCLAEKMEPSIGVLTLIYSIGRIAGRSGNVRMTVREIWGDSSRKNSSGCSSPAT